MRPQKGDSVKRQEGTGRHCEPRMASWEVRGRSERTSLGRPLGMQRAKNGTLMGGLRGKT